MPRVILLLAAIAAIWLLYRYLRAVPVGQRRSAYLKVGLGLLVLAIAVATLTSRMHWLGAAVTALVVGVGRMVPLLLRLFPMLQWVRGQRANAASGRQSTVETQLLRMVLDHDSGAMSGLVLAGDFAGQSLDDMEREQLDSLLAQFQQQDEDSARLLQTYLAKRFGEQEQYRQTGSPGSSELSRAEALAILGLEEGASDAEIDEAHRRLMQKMHPDRGGSDYLAARINQAKDLLSA